MERDFHPSLWLRLSQPQTLDDIPMIVALDVEGTLISNAVSQIARPGLASFLDNCHEAFDRVCVFTSVPEDRFRSIAQELVERGEAPGWFAGVEFVRWTGPHKRLECIPGATPHDALLLDDIEAYVAPDQRDRWVPVVPFVHPYPANDTELARIADLLMSRLQGKAESGLDR